MEDPQRPEQTSMHPRIPGDEDVPHSFTAHAVMRRTFLRLLGTVFAAELTAMLLLHFLLPTDLPPLIEATVDAALLTVLVGLPTWFLILQPVSGALREEHQALARRAETLRAESAHQEFEARLHRAFEMSDSEPSLQRVLRRTIDHLSPDAPMELLLADSSEAHLRQEVAGGAAAGGFGCPVDSPANCVAARRGQARIFPDSGALDACPMLLDACEEGCAAACVPMSVGGRTVGVLRTSRSRGEEIPRSLVRDMEVVASQAGNRLGLLRAMEASELAASTDPLTGVLNRRRLDHVLGTWVRAGRSFAVVLADIDHFKRLNDSYSHETGDRCLRAFTQAIRDVVRSNDLVARLGGEEFVLAMPEADAPKAAEVVERIRAALPDALTRAAVPRFTASWGVTDTSASTDIEELLRLADRALYAAKHAGRDRVVLSSEEAPPAPEDEGAPSTRSHAGLRALTEPEPATAE
ncbi:MAG: diguanylate cyclase [Myxococcota bacterium]